MSDFFGGGNPFGGGGMGGMANMLGGFKQKMAALQADAERAEAYYQARLSLQELLASISGK